MLTRALATIDCDAITRNVRRLAAVAAPARLCAVVKADGYGHGATRAGRAALAGGAGALAVVGAAEAVALRTDGVDAPLLVLGALTDSELTSALRADAEVVVWTPEQVARIVAHPDSRSARVHVKLDSGLGRLGTRDPLLATAAVAAVDASETLTLAGLMTHFATADEDPVFAREQLARFHAWADPLRRAGVLAHAANSAATLTLPEAHLDMVRCGVACYGLDPLGVDPFAHGLAPALTLRSYLAEVKPIAPGESVGYGRRLRAERPGWIGTIPIGYADGVRRSLSEHADVLIEGRRARVRGVISMDNLTVELDAEPPPVGAEVVLLGEQGSDRVLAEEWARNCETINYEIVTSIGPRVPRQNA